MSQQLPLPWPSHPNPYIQAKSRYSRWPRNEGRQSLAQNNSRRVDRHPHPSHLSIQGGLVGVSRSRSGGDKGPFPEGYSDRSFLPLAITHPALS